MLENNIRYLGEKVTELNFSLSLCVSWIDTHSQENYGEFKFIFPKD